MGEKDKVDEDRVAEKVKATGSEVVAKPLNVEKRKHKAEAGKDDKEVLEENKIADYDDSAVGD